MAFLTTGFSSDSGPVVQGNGMHLRAMTTSDFDAWAQLRDESRAHLVAWEPTWAKNELTQASFRRRIRHYRREAREGVGYALAICDDKTQEMLGGLTLTNIRRGVSQSAVLGYWTGARYVRQGIMTRAVAAIIPFCFKELRLHRLEAASMPSNSASIKVLERNGFVREGFARRLLKINGVWEDHIIFSLLADDYELSETFAE